MTTSLIYITTGSAEEASAIARALVEERLVACANILGAMTSIYRWRGSVQEDDEVALIVKTRDDLVEAAIARVKELHSYDCPCAVALPIAKGNPEFLDWIAEETREGTTAG